ncbi:hypothetical protein B0T20DRAFT_418072 [Sordaria brevicollis]|uniref:Uncharacterized protein n=1 Tax=Sordaria brevicollis TaxID=83679 RepID=A0AAE0PB00_SORBR|nr:hypothetical protein B0T20DRAFT_418072 [Sordaria brevicollis]
MEAHLIRGKIWQLSVAAAAAVLVQIVAVRLFLTPVLCLSLCGRLVTPSRWAAGSAGSISMVSVRHSSPSPDKASPRSIS